MTHHVSGYFHVTVFVLDVLIISNLDFRAPKYLFLTYNS